MANDETAVRGSMDIGFNTVIGAVACRNESRIRIFRFDSGKTSVRNEQSGIFIDFNGIHVIPTFLTVIIT
jgi:hypothetical protein